MTAPTPGGPVRDKPRTGLGRTLALSGERNSARDVLAGSVAKHDARPWAKVLRDGKVCSRCKRHWPASEFVANARSRDRLSSWCRLCQTESTRRWRADNAEAINAKRRTAYREAHPLVVRQCSECGVELVGAANRKTCSAACRAARGRRLNPAVVAARERRKVVRRREARRKAREL